MTYREDRYETEVDHKMTVIPDTEQPANYKGMSWSAALKKKYGVRGNVLNDMEWIAFKSDNYSSVNGTIHYTVTIKCNSGKSNLKFRPSFLSITLVMGLEETRLIILLRMLMIALKW